MMIYENSCSVQKISVAIPTKKGRPLLSAEIFYWYVTGGCSKTKVKRRSERQKQQMLNEFSMFYEEKKAL